MRAYFPRLTTLVENSKLFKAPIEGVTVGILMLCLGKKN